MGSEARATPASSPQGSGLRLGFRAGTSRPRAANVRDDDLTRLRRQRTVHLSVELNGVDDGIGVRLRGGGLLDQALESGGDAVGAKAVETGGFGMAEDRALIGKAAIARDGCRIAPGEVVVLDKGAIGVIADEASAAMMREIGAAPGVARQVSGKRWILFGAGFGGIVGLTGGFAVFGGGEQIFVEQWSFVGVKEHGGMFLKYLSAARGGENLAGVKIRPLASGGQALLSRGVAISKVAG
jgi:hypothetical protein